MRATYKSEAAAIDAAERNGWTLHSDGFGPCATQPDGTVVRLLISAPAFRNHLRWHWVRDEETGS